MAQARTAPRSTRAEPFERPVARRLPLRASGTVQPDAFDVAPERDTVQMARAVLSRAGVDELTLALVRKHLGLR